MLHSVKICDKDKEIYKHTLEDWHLVPSSRPTIATPKVRQSTITIPGANGVLDVSTSLTGYPLYDNREGSIEFIVLNQDDIDTLDCSKETIDKIKNNYKQWNTLYSEIANYIHGKTLQLILDDDPAWYYKGMFSVDNWDSSDGGRSTLTISYSLYPYKLSTNKTDEPWIWDTFNFEEGVATDRLYIFSIDATNGERVYDINSDSGVIGAAPVCPKIIVKYDNDDTYKSAKAYLQYQPDTLPARDLVTYELVSGENQFPDVVLYGDTAVFRIQATKGVKLDVSISYERSSL